MGNGESNSGFQMKLKEVGSLLNYFLFEYFKKKDKSLKRKKLETFNFIYLIILRGEKFLN